MKRAGAIWPGRSGYASRPETWPARHVSTSTWPDPQAFSTATATTWPTPAGA